MKKSVNILPQARRIIISGGGTGGHIFPAIAIANALKENDANVKILFIGAAGRMEMEKIPAAGYRIIGLPVRGFNRKNPLKNIAVVYKLIVSLFIVRKIIKLFRPDVVVGVGGYVSAPALWTASRMRIPVVIQEQNSYAGIANKLLSRKADKICVAYEGMERFFPKEKIVFTGNPVRIELAECHLLREQGINFFELDANKRTILVMGGSLGARSINQSVEAYLERLPDNIQLLWQTGNNYFEHAKMLLDRHKTPNVKIFAFINRIDLAYSAADLVVSRAGAGAISELSIAAKPCILTPSPNVAEDHQTKNAMVLVEKNAAIMVSDSDAHKKLMSKAIETVQNKQTLDTLAKEIKNLAKHHAAESIAAEIFYLLNKPSCLKNSAV